MPWCMTVMSKAGVNNHMQQRLLRCENVNMKFAF